MIIFHQIQLHIWPTETLNLPGLFNSGLQLSRWRKARAAPGKSLGHLGNVEVLSGCGIPSFCIDEMYVYVLCVYIYIVVCIYIYIYSSIHIYVYRYSSVYIYMCMLAAAANITAMDQILLPDSRIPSTLLLQSKLHFFSTQKPKFVSPKMGYPKKKQCVWIFLLKSLGESPCFPIFALLSPCFFLLKSPFWVGKNPQFHPHFPRLKSPPPGTYCPLPRQPWWHARRSRRRSSDPQPSDVPRGGEKLGKTQEICLFYPIEWRWTIVSSICFPEKTRSI